MMLRPAILVSNWMDSVTGGSNRLKRWLAAQDRTLVILWAMTLAGFVARWYFAVGFLLGDDGSYVDLVRDTLNGYFMTIEPIGQYAYRPMWIYPIAAGIKLFGWDYHILVLYPMLCGSLIPILTALWVRRHLPAGSKAPLACAIILQCYPTMFVDSLVLVNEIPMIFWALLCVNLFGMAYSHLAQSTRFGSRPSRLAGFSFLAGTAFGAAYQVKATAIPVLGLWLLGDLVLQLRRYGKPRIAPLALAAVTFALPILAIQTFYLVRIGTFLGNFTGEMRLYELWLPREYFQGQMDLYGTLIEYVDQLLYLTGSVGYQTLLHSIWVWVALGLILVLGVVWKSMPRDYRSVGVMFLLITVALFLFMEFWPTRISPYYAPNCYTGRPWRYIDVIAPTIVAWIVVVFMQPDRFERGFFRWLRFATFAAGFGVAGYSLVVHIHEFDDREAEFHQVAETQEILKPYLNFPHYIDSDGCGNLLAVLGMPKLPAVYGKGAGPMDITLDFRHVDGVCVWTGGARRYGVNADDAYTPENVKPIGGELHLVHTWLCIDRPWRLRPLQLWVYINPNAKHEPPKQP